MDKFFVDKGGKVEEFAGGKDRRRNVRFPVSLSVRYGEGHPLTYSNFILNISKGGVFIVTGRSFKKGAKLIMRFYIPPDEKLLGEFEGKVVGVNTDDPRYPGGMHIRFTNCTEEDLKRLEDFLEENRHLVDNTA